MSSGRRMTQRDHRSQQASSSAQHASTADLAQFRSIPNNPRRVEPRAKVPIQLKQAIPSHGCLNQRTTIQRSFFEVYRFYHPPDASQCRPETQNTSDLGHRLESPSIKEISNAGVEESVSSPWVVDRKPTAGDWLAAGASDFSALSKSGPEAKQDRDHPMKVASIKGGLAHRQHAVLFCCRRLQ